MMNRKEQSLRIAMAHAGITDYRVAAKRAGVSTRALYRWRTGDPLMRGKTALKIMTGLGIEPRDFLSNAQIHAAKEQLIRTAHRKERTMRREALKAAGAPVTKDGNKLGLRRVRESIT